MKKETVLHQHIDVNKKAFGKLHPLDAVHKKQSTQKAHILTLINIKKEDFVRKQRY